MRRLFTSFLLFLTPALLLAELRVDEGEINGAKFAIARPAHWNGKVLLLAHGYRDNSRPLVADLFPEHVAYHTLIQEGWLIAKTSYRRNGIIVAEAIDDLEALRQHIVKTSGAPKRVLLEGESMGGLIVTLMAERYPSHYAGAVAIGAALDLDENGRRIKPSYRPKIPLVFLTNQSELKQPVNYVIAGASSENTNLRPALFRISRDGHVNVNQAERLVALRAVDAWIERDRRALPLPPSGSQYYDATIAPQAVPSRVTLHPDAHGFDCHAVEVSAVYGNVFIDAQRSDFASVGIAPQTWFDLKSGHALFRVFYGSDFNSVKIGDLVVFPNADGFFWLARNQSDAAALAGIHTGDTISIRQPAR